MDTFEIYPLLPLPKIYRPPIMWKISMLFAYFALILVSLLLLVSSIMLFSISLSPTKIGIVLLTSFISLLIISIMLGASFYLINQLCLRLELCPQGIIYSAFGQRLYTPWTNISSYDFLGNSKVIILHEGIIKGSLEEGLQRNIAVRETARWYVRWWLGSAHTRLLLLPRAFWNFEQTNLDLQLLARYLQKYAPQASQF
ncbi:hypothetical protein [Dictyobacter kobayashii]|uniref:hypothetical protein n=1 Tax=Dictyobacter kobayashii TaxID=2014872 RepID=UPI000F840832|nr:hypothetical protein [Dictyobacter kobayashii]